MVSLPAPQGRRRPPRTLPGEFAVFAGFSGLLTIAAVFAALPPGPPVGIGVLLAFTAAAGWWTTIPAGSSIGAMAWLFYLGFVLHTGGNLGLRGPADAVVLVVLVAVGASTAALRRRPGRRVRISRKSHVMPQSFQPEILMILVVPTDDRPGPWPERTGHPSGGPVANPGGQYS